MAESAELTRFRGTRKTYLRNISNQERHILDLIQKPIDEKTETSLTASKNSLLEKFEKVKILNENILEHLTGGEFEKELEENLDKTDQIHEILAKVDYVLNRNQVIILENSKAKTVSSTETSSGNIKVQLPKLEIVKFDGDIINWQSFWDQFDSAIHSNDRISDVNKFAYLQSYLSEDARNTISGLSPTSLNYREAIDILKQRYGNTQVLISSYMKKFVLLPKIVSDNDVKGLRKILDQVECSVRNLRTLKVETSCYGSLLVPLVNEKLPNELRVNIAKSFANDIWDIDIMINFLKKEVEAKERSFAVGMSFDLDDDIKNSSDVFSSSALYSQNKYSSRKPKVQHCVFCDKNNRSSNRCFKITDMEARKDLVKQKKLCFVCLEKGHAAYSCTLKNYSCKKCHRKHNIAICTFSKQNTQKHFPSTEERSETPSTTSNISTNKNNVLLQTATVSVSNNIQLLFDSGSQRSYISTEIRNRLKLPTLRTERLVINTFGNQDAQIKNIDVVPLTIICPDRKLITVECLCTSMICADVTNQNTQFVSTNYVISKI